MAKTRSTSPDPDHSSTAAAPEFVRKLFQMVSNPVLQHVSWGPDNDCFFVKDVNEFTKSVLPRLFKHSNYASFVRQLNKYGFHKIKNPYSDLSLFKRDSELDPVLDAIPEDAWVFRHPHFHADRIADLEKIQRKLPNPNSRRGRNNASPERCIDDDGQKPIVPDPAIPSISLQRRDSYDDAASYQMPPLPSQGQRDSELLRLEAYKASVLAQFQSYQQEIASLRCDIVGLRDEMRGLRGEIRQMGGKDLSLHETSNKAWMDLPFKTCSSNVRTDLTTTIQSPQPLTFGCPNLTPPIPRPGTSFSLDESWDVKSGNPDLQEQKVIDAWRDETTAQSSYVPEWTKPPRVLLVDDNDLTRKLSSKFLKIFGCIFDFAVDGVSAVQKMSTEKYDLVLMDIIMPKLDGVSATSVIRKFDSTTPIISMTSNFAPNEIMTYYCSGMNDILAKPFTRQGLLEVLEKHLIHMHGIQQKVGTLAFGATGNNATPAMNMDLNIDLPYISGIKRPSQETVDSRDSKRSRFEDVS